MIHNLIARRITLLLAISIKGFTCLSQESGFQIYFHPNLTLHPAIDTIDQKEFQHFRNKGIRCNAQVFQPGEDEDSLMRASGIKQAKADSLFMMMLKKYPAAFNKSDSCLTLIGKERQVELCNSSKDKAEWNSYQVRDYQRGYLIIERNGYEMWEYILFNPESGNLCSMSNFPYFINDSLICSAGDYYGDGNFQVAEIINEKKYFGFDIVHWEVVDCYRLGNTFGLSIRSGEPEETPGQDKIKFIRIRFLEFK